jgi:hypothetical protein
LDAREQGKQLHYCKGAESVRGRITPRLFKNISLDLEPAEFLALEIIRLT